MISSTSFLVLFLLTTDAFTTSQLWTRRQQGHNKPMTSRTHVMSTSLKMDLEEPLIKQQQRLFQRYDVELPTYARRIEIPKSSHDDANAHIPMSAEDALKKHDHDKMNRHTPVSVEDALKKHGLPWMTSIDPTHPADPERGLFYMPFFECQMNFMKEHLTNLRVIPTESKAGKDLSYIQKGRVRMVTLTFASEEFRKIRLTVYDAGNKTQVFTSLFYPKYNLPVLGIDLLQFNSDRHLCVVDMQPIFMPNKDVDTTSMQHEPYEQLLKPIRDQYPNLQGQMTQRFYDETQFFSNQMLYSRFEELHSQKGEIEADNHPVYRDLYPAFQQYLEVYLDLVQSTKPNVDQVPTVLKAQAAYDTYSAHRDPAHALFTKVFGEDFANDFVYDVLFSLSSRQQEAEPQG